MASPFYLFRKYQKAFLVVAGVLAMFIFVVADPLSTWLQSSGGGGARSAKTVVASWDGGSMNLQELESLTQRRYKISEFLRNLIGIAATEVEQEGGTPLQPSLPDFRLPRNATARSVQIGAVSNRLLAELAEKSEISVGQDAINHYLREWGLRRMGDDDMAKLLGRVGLSDKALFSGLRELMMADFYMSSYSLATMGVTPEERWQDWRRINERIAVEAAVLPATKFLAEVPEPTDSQLQQFYELHKDRLGGTQHLLMNTRLPSPDPGFREPRRVKLQYLIASLGDWTQKSLDTVTDAEIADYYEENKAVQFVKASTSTSAAGLFDDEAKEDSTDDEAAETTEPAEEKSDEAPVADESSYLPRKSPFRLAALQTKVEEEEEEEETASEESSEAESNAEDAPETDSDDKTEDEKPVQYVPLADVSMQIRRSLARAKAADELKKIVDRVYGSLQAEYTPYGYKVVTARTDETEVPAPPAKLSDYKSIATETGLISEETVLLSQGDMAGSSVGQAYEAQTGRELVHQGMFDDQEVFEPYRAIDVDGNSYLVCKVEDVPSRVPDFDEVREAVVTAWKQQEAAKLALAKATELSKKVEKSSEPLAEVARAAGYETAKTDLFSWLTFGTTQADMRRGPHLGGAPPLEAVGIDFMTSAFKLEADQKIPLLNYDHSNAYLIQLDRRELTEAEMRQRFLKEANNWYGARVMNTARRGNTQRQLLKQLSEEAGLNADKLEEFLSKDSR